MKVVNVDANRQVAKKILHLDVISFVLDVLRPLERDLYHDQMYHSIICGLHYSGNLPFFPIRKFEDYGYENAANLVHTIPIYLRDSRPERINETDIVDLLGAYYPNRSQDNPYIELFLSNIDSASNGNDKHFRYLLTTVLIHEIAHAALDIFSREHCNSVVEKVSYCTKFGKWREESMANAIALRIIKDYGNQGFYDYAKQFMLSQPQEYALGVQMEDFGYWDFRSVVDGKEDGVDSTLQQEWLKYVSNTPTANGLHEWNDILSSDDVYQYKGKYYTREKGLVYDIVDDVLADYEKSNGRKMSSAEFTQIFPNIRTGAEMSYEPSGKVQGNNEYEKLIYLSDVEYSLYYFWDNKTFIQFVQNTNCKYKIIKNY